MPKISNTCKVSIPVGSEIVTFICRTPSGSEHSKFLNSRFSTKGRKVESNVYPARAEFMDSITTDVENVTFVNSEGDDVPLNAATVFSEGDKAKYPGMKTFRDLIPLNWKSSAAQQFEDSAERPEDDEPSKN